MQDNGQGDCGHHRPVREYPDAEQGLSLRADSQHIAHLREGQGGEDHGLPGGIIRTPSPETYGQGHEPHQHAYPQDLPAQAPCKDTLLGRVRWSPHGVPFCWFHRQRQSRQAIGHQVDPQNLQGQEGQRHAQEGGRKHHPYLPGVGSERVFDEFADVVVDGASFFDGGYDGGEIVIQQHHVRRLFGDIGAGDAHRHPNIGFLERWRIVDAITCHGHNLSIALQCVDDLELVLRGHASVNRYIFDKRFQFLFRGLSQLLAGHHAVIGGNVQLLGDELCSQGMIAGNHDRMDTSLLSPLHSLAHLRARRIDHADEADEDHVLFQLGFVDFFGHSGQRPKCHAQHSLAFLGQAIVGIQNALVQVIRHRCGATTRPNLV